MKKIFVFLCLSVLPALAPAQYWIQSCGGPTFDEGLDVDGDGSGHYYATGYFTTAASFGSFSVASAGVEDIYIIKGDTSGVVQWLKTAGGSGSDKAESIDADSNGGFVITGSFYGTAMFESQPVVSLGQQDVFVARYDSSGTLLWVRSGGGAGSDAGHSVALDPSGNVVVTGEFSGSCSFGPFTLVSAAGSIDVFVVKYSPSGTVLWARQGSGNFTDRGTDITTDAAGNIYIGGLFSDTITFDVQHPNTILNAMFLVSYDTAGQERWFRWMSSGGTSGMGGTEYINGGIHVAGSFSGTLFFFDGVGSVSLTGSYANNIFLCRYDSSGTLVWNQSSGSASSVSALSLTAGFGGTSVVAGLFSCCFSDFSVQYGGGVMCSMGLSDVFVAGYDISGNWQWARQYGSRGEDVVNGLCSYGDSLLVTTGSYRNEFFSTASPTRFRGYNGNHFQSNGGVYCGDTEYGQYVSYMPVGNSDIYVNGNVDLGRQPLDFFMRSGPGCNRSFPSLCVDENLSNPLPCPDTLHGCGSINLYAKSLAWSAFGYAPVFYYTWNTGSVTAGTFVLTDGEYGVAMTDSACYSGSDSVWVTMHSNSAQPRISDSKGINVDTAFTQPVRLCQPDSVLLFCTNAGSNTVRWSGFPIGQNPITVNSSGTYLVQFVDSFGCSSGAAFVSVFSSNAMATVLPNITCIEDVDGDDTLDLCEGEFFTLYLYDSLSNPGALVDCFPDMDTAYWMSSHDTSFNYVSPTQCVPNAINFFVPSDTGNFDVLFTAFVIRQNDCDSDTVHFNRAMHIRVHPLPSSGGLSLSISGPSQMCFGDTVLLVSSGGPNHEWSNGFTGDSLYVTQAGFYFATVADTVTNAWGCQGVSTGAAGILITYFSQPSLLSVPGNGLICLNDSVALVCSAGSGVFQWQGPAGTPAINNDTIYVTTPGTYSCIVTVAPGCDLVTNAIQVTQYSTPFIAISPGDNLCLADSVLLTAVGNASSNFLWDPPFSDTISTHVAFFAGTYTCHITSCGIVTPASVTLFVDTATAMITSSATTFCQGDSVLLSAGPAASYQWLPSGDTLPVLTVTQGGLVSLVVISPLGCTDTASTLITEVPNNLLPPLVADTQVCAGIPVQLVASSPDTISWSTVPSYSQAIYTGDTFLLASPMASQAYYVFAHSGACKSAFDSMLVTVVSVDNPGANDTSVCSCSPVQLTAFGTDSIFWSTAPNPAQIFHAGPVLTLPAVTAPVMYYLYSRNGSCYGTWDSAYIDVVTIGAPVVADTTVCEGIPVVLNATGPDTIYWSAVPVYGQPIHAGPSFSLPGIGSDTVLYLYVQNQACRSGILPMTVQVDPVCHEFSVTNVMTPNGDGLNDFFPEPPGDYVFNIRIFNRWGWEVYSRQEATTGWDGRDDNGNKVPDGTYYYVLHVIFRDNFIQEFDGHIMVLNN